MIIVSTITHSLHLDDYLVRFTACCRSRLLSRCMLIRCGRHTALPLPRFTHTGYCMVQRACVLGYAINSFQYLQLRLLLDLANLQLRRILLQYALVVVLPTR